MEMEKRYSNKVVVPQLQNFGFDGKWKYTKEEKKALEFFELDLNFSEIDFRNSLNKINYMKYDLAFNTRDSLSEIEKLIDDSKNTLNFCIYKQRTFDDTLKKYFSHYCLDYNTGEGISFAKVLSENVFLNIMGNYQYAIFEMNNLMNLISNASTSEEINKYVSDFDKDFSKLFELNYKQLPSLKEYQEEKLHRYDKRDDEQFLQSYGEKNLSYEKDDSKVVKPQVGIERPETEGEKIANILSDNVKKSEEVIKLYDDLIRKYVEFGLLELGSELYRKAAISLYSIQSHSKDYERVLREYKIALDELNDGIINSPERCKRQR